MINLPPIKSIPYSGTSTAKSRRSAYAVETKREEHKPYQGERRKNSNRRKARGDAQTINRRLGADRRLGRVSVRV